MILHFILHLIPIMEIKPYLFLQTYIQCPFDVITLAQEFANRMLRIKQFPTDYIIVIIFNKLRNMSKNGKLYPTNLLMTSMKLFYNFQTFAMKMRCQGRMHCASKESKKYEILILFSSPRKNNLKQNFQAFQVFTLQPGQLLSSRVVLVCKFFLHVSIQKPRIVLRIIC